MKRLQNIGNLTFVVTFCMFLPMLTKRLELKRTTFNNAEIRRKDYKYEKPHS